MYYDVYMYTLVIYLSAVLVVLHVWGEGCH